MSTAPVDVLMVGTGEYTTGFVNGKASDSDKGAGVVVRLFCCCFVLLHTAANVTLVALSS